ncbi:MAG: Rrf2 family transcriptional regulator [Planctomycetes bacterium]|nr:Rrf2 family transcriptional regulator [Planctomycetota bacterium]
MLHLTRKTDYALVALSYLAQQRQAGQTGAPDEVSARKIADHFGMPLPLLMNILKELAQAKIIGSTRGSHGGYRLIVAPEAVSLLEVIEAMEGPVKFTECSEGLPILGQGCAMQECCTIRGPVRKLNQRIRGFLSEVTLADLAESKEETVTV